MAKQEIITVTDDLDGSPAVGTVRFGLDRSRYEIDLNKKNEATLRKALVPYIAVARIVEENPGRASRPSTSQQHRDEVRAARQWAIANGYEVSARGRVSQEILDLHRQAHS